MAGFLTLSGAREPREQTVSGYLKSQIAPFFAVITRASKLLSDKFLQFRFSCHN